MKHVMNWFGRMGLFVGGLLGMTYQPVIAKAVQPDTGPRPARSRYQRKLVEYPSFDVQPKTRQVMRAELRAMAFKQTAYGLLRNEPRHDRRSASVERINVRSFIAGFSWGGMLTHDQLVWCRAWARRSGRLFYYERQV